MKKLSVPPEMTSVAEVRDAIRADLALGESKEDTLFLVAVSEVVTNAIEAQKRVGEMKPLSISIEPDPPTVTVCDLGDGYDPNRPPRRNGVVDRGRGLMIARAVVPEMRWEQNEPRGTRFVLPFVRSPLGAENVPSGDS